ncbi:acid phosphatase 1-like [Carex rostrata]
MTSTPLPAAFLPLLLLLSCFASCGSAKSILRTLPEDHRLRLSTGRSRSSKNQYCDSWRLSVETNNAGKWRTIPTKCISYVGAYMDGEKYQSDSDVAAHDSLTFAKDVTLAGDEKDIWVFDVDETVLSNAPYYADNGWGSGLFNETSFDEWVFQAKAPALSSSLKLYNELLGLGFQVVFLTGRAENQRNVTVQNLLDAGYHSWERLILRGDSDIGKPAVTYKSGKRAELEAEGYRIYGNSGDQWSDLFGLPMAVRSFKLPNPMYYIS